MFHALPLVCACVCVHTPAVVLDPCLHLLFITLAKIDCSYIIPSIHPSIHFYFAVPSLLLLQPPPPAAAPPSRSQPATHALGGFSVKTTLEEGRGRELGKRSGLGETSSRGWQLFATFALYTSALVLVILSVVAWAAPIAENARNNSRQFYEWDLFVVFPSTKVYFISILANPIYKVANNKKWNTFESARSYHYASWLIQCFDRFEFQWTSQYSFFPLAHISLLTTPHPPIDSSISGKNLYIGTDFLSVNN